MIKETRTNFPIFIGRYLERDTYYDVSNHLFLATRQNVDLQNRVPLLAGINIGCLSLVRWINRNFLIETVSYRILTLLVLAALVVIGTRIFIKKSYANLTLREIDLSGEEIQELIKNGKKALRVLSITFCITILVGTVSFWLYILSSNFIALFLILVCILLVSALLETHLLQRYWTVRFLERECHVS